jgi:flagellin-like hook-associated protein FlgL
MVSSALPIDTWFHVKPKEYAALAPEQEEKFKKEQFSMRVGYLGGYSLGLIEGLSSLDQLYEKNKDLFKAFYSEVSRTRPSTISVEVLIEYLSNISKKNALSEFGPLPNVPSSALVPKKKFPKIQDSSSDDLISFSKNYQETFLKPQSGVDSNGTAIPVTLGVDEAWSYFKKILHASGDGNSRPELDESCFDFRTLFKLIDISVADPANLDTTKNEKVWIGNEAVDLGIWEKWFDIGNTEGKYQAITIYALRFVRITLEKVEAFPLLSNTDKIKPSNGTINNIQSKINSILLNPQAATDTDASGLRSELSAIIDAVQEYTQKVGSIPENNNEKLVLDRDLSIAEGLINRFGDDLTNPPPIFNLFGRRLFTVSVKENDVSYTFQYASPFNSASSDRTSLTTQEQNSVGEATSLLGGGFEDFNRPPFRDSYFYKSLLVEPQEDSDTKDFLNALLPRNDSNASMTIESVKETVEILNPAYVAGLCAAYAVSISWEGKKDFFKDAEKRVNFRNQIINRINTLIETQAASLIDLGSISTPFQFFNVSYVMGLRSLRFFADFVVDKVAMESGANLVISRLRTQLPQFFTNFQDVNDIKGLIAYVDRGALAVYNRLNEQDAKISELNSVVAKLTDQVQDLTIKLGAAENRIQSQNSTIQSLNSDLDNLKNAFEQLSSLSETIKNTLENELKKAQETIKTLNDIVKLVKEDLELTRDRLKQAQALLDAWTKAGQNAQGALQGVEVLAYATTGFLIGGPAGAAISALFGEDIVNAVSDGKKAFSQGIKSAGKTIKSWFS